MLGSSIYLKLLPNKEQHETTTGLGFDTIRWALVKSHEQTDLIAERAGEIIDIAGSHQELLRIRLTLTGIMAPLWKSDCWFSMPGGVLMRFEGSSGPPGSPRTVVTRVQN